MIAGQTQTGEPVRPGIETLLTPHLRCLLVKYLFADRRLCGNNGAGQVSRFHATRKRRTSVTPAGPIADFPSLIVGQAWDPAGHNPIPAAALAVMQLLKEWILTPVLHILYI
jgi:hypothetical protein